MNTLFKKTVGLLVLAVTLVTTSCRKDDFDTPLPGGADPDLVANLTIADLKGRFDTLKFETITDDWIIAGVVTADDRSGNFYKTVILQDSTAGIAVRIDVSDYYTKYPIGRRVFIKLKGLVMGDYNDLIQLGGFVDNSNPTFPSVEPIPFAQVSEHLFPGQYNIPITPEDVTIAQLTSSTTSLFDYQNRLIRISNVEFASADTSKNYADAQSSANRTIFDCNGDELILRSSNYATFAGSGLPNCNGSITGIFSVYGNDAQMYIRDTFDVVMDASRCNGTVCSNTGGGGGGGTPVLVPISTARGYFTGTTTTAPADKKIKGIVITDRTNANTDPKNVAIQDSSAGIVVRFSAAHAFNLGDEIEVNISGQEVTEYAGLLEINNVPLTNAIVTGSGTIAPRITDIAQINANFELWESTLVQVTNTTITSTTGSTYSGPRTITDPTGTMTLYTRSAATFSGLSFPTTPVTITGVLVPFNATKQICIRSTADVQ